MYEKYTPLYIHIKWKKINLSPISRPITIGNSIENIYNYYQIVKAVFLQTVFLPSFCSKYHISANTLNIGTCNISLFSFWCALFKNPIKCTILFLEKGLILRRWVTNCLGGATYLVKTISPMSFLAHSPWKSPERPSLYISYMTSSTVFIRMILWLMSAINIMLFSNWAIAVTKPGHTSSLATEDTIEYHHARNITIWQTK